MNKLLLVVDPQIDFISGTLAVPGAAEAMNALASYLLGRDGQYEYKVVSNDWHPINHCSFQAFDGDWPPHCIQYSMGAAIYPPLIEPLFTSKSATKVLQKGNNPKFEELSIFKNVTSTNHMSMIMKMKNIQQIDLCGIAGDVCVLETLKDGIQLFGKEKFNVLMPYVASLDGGQALTRFVTENFIKAIY